MLPGPRSVVEPPRVPPRAPRLARGSMRPPLVRAPWIPPTGWRELPPPAVWGPVERVPLPVRARGLARPLVCALAAVVATLAVLLWA